ncbi:hypothetical protein LY76DRAFT_610346 [Colletotrichum caudatum]|nr:hypothetical protein LY76DRAFT_610346 [Colletotrichum caudatum]
MCCMLGIFVVFLLVHVWGPNIVPTIDLIDVTPSELVISLAVNAHTRLALWTSTEIPWDIHKAVAMVAREPSIYPPRYQTTRYSNRAYVLRVVRVPGFLDATVSAQDGRHFTHLRAD